uniref:Bystin n=1 Tax=Syphacia muris TaxID=451379 RepID=A0A0N5AFQ7_9BILA
MGKKSGKIKSGTGDFVGASAVPLNKQIEQSLFESNREFPRVKQRTLKRSKPADEYIDEDLSNKIVKSAGRQKREIEEEESAAADGEAVGLKRMRQISLGGLSMASVSDDEQLSDVEDYDDNVVELNPEDEAAIEKFMIKRDTPAPRTLYDIIQEKIEQKKFELETANMTNDDLQLKNLDKDVVEMYKEIGRMLSKYRSGKIPKAFKILPKLINWEQILYLTNPDGWSAAAMYQATRIFASNLSVHMCQRFYMYVLLPRIRDDIDEYKKLNYHLYQALHKAMYKPQAFVKGILLPLCESGTCTLREATIFGSVLNKGSFPMLHAAAAMLKIAQMEYSGANSLFLRIFFEKNYTLPYRAIDAIVQHFLNFRGDERQLPVLWHQAFLAFVERYKSDITEVQRKSLLGLLKVHFHHQISPEIRKALVNIEKPTESVADERMET